MENIFRHKNRKTVAFISLIGICVLASMTTIILVLRGPVKAAWTEATDTVLQDTHLGSNVLFTKRRIKAGETINCDNTEEHIACGANPPDATNITRTRGKKALVDIPAGTEITPDQFRP